MLRLWRDRLHIGLYGEHAILARNSGRKRAVYSAPLDGDVIEWLKAVEHVLDGAGDFYAGTPLTCVVSDRAAIVHAVPWRDGLRTTEERIGYARACLEQIGASAVDDWELHVSFRRYKAHGLVYGLPRDFLEGMLDVAAQRRLRLVSVLPVSAVAYDVQRPDLGSHTTLALMIEGSRASLLGQTRTGLYLHDTEPLVGTLDATLRRLFTRVGLNGVSIARCEVWAPDADSEEISKIVATYVDEGRLHMLPNAQWEQVR
ncbi:hypothetical protein [Duganella qianjiadongensis]|uniref:Uncharacterized protein n=1 Tax=Duganella qianjiadongensis TaxID=2692176 RepID=A0ABW9VNU4_9BURK|nr:hypothetical protein [Duganella qianjiadongensis]MYM41172.1 hypothetical protein [Duganella qianjiadongensis]